jgi:3-oxoacyl-[acyl-carrier-protein] synthase III
LIKENEQLKLELAAAKAQSEDAVAQRMHEDLARFGNNADKLTTLNSQIATLQAQNAELMTVNETLKSKDSELTRQVQDLTMENTDLNSEILRQQSRTPEELLAEATAKMANLNATLLEPS